MEVFNLFAGLLAPIGWLFIIVFGVQSFKYLCDPWGNATRQIRRLKVFIVVANVGLILAYGLLMIHLVRSDTFPYKAGPFEIHYPTERASIHLLAQVTQAGVLYWSIKQPSKHIPSLPLWIIFLFAVMGTLGSLLYNMAYTVSLCCENPLATYWGFPFSWLYGIAQDPPFDRYERWTAYLYVDRFADQMMWHVILWKLIATFGFWWSVVFVISSGLFRLFDHQTEPGRSSTNLP